ncbi:hypothetical protein [Rhizobium sp. LCM 4573]|uniref:hypothetical protein n=1 Tax=Rhizobium sp. LCM 4573 TaxID=1848291 RepID=UPI0008DB3333|nr:hypothetical protein [Rhizobium sp. LCM 4573]OHV78532.1 hypothetical protein LCM4573_26510 [Rhizobium sp. LCM 4573]
MTTVADATSMMLCWNPGTADVALIPWPDTARQSDQYRSTSLACYTHIRTGNFEYRKTTVFILAMTLIVRDKCPAEAVHEALLGLAEYQDGCPDDMPGIQR